MNKKEKFNEYFEKLPVLMQGYVNAAEEIDQKAAEIKADKRYSTSFVQDELRNCDMSKKAAHSKVIDGVIANRKELEAAIREVFDFKTFTENRHLNALLSADMDFTAADFAQLAADYTGEVFTERIIDTAARKAGFSLENYYFVPGQILAEYDKIADKIGNSMFNAAFFPPYRQPIDCQTDVKRVLAKLNGELPVIVSKLPETVEEELAADIAKQRHAETQSHYAASEGIEQDYKHDADPAEQLKDIVAEFTKGASPEQIAEVMAVLNGTEAEKEAEE